MKKDTKDYSKKIYMEVLRVFAAFLVIANHVNNPVMYYSSDSKSWYATITLFFVSKIAVPIFMMISGSLLLCKIDPFEKSIKRVCKWIITIIIFSTVYYLYIYREQGYDLIELLKCILYGATYAYWYLYLYLGILIMLPILQKLTQALSKKDIEIFLFISLGINGLLPFLSIYTDFQVGSDLMNVLFSPYIGLMFLGYYIDKYVEISIKYVGCASLGFVLLIAFQVWQTGCFYQIDNQNYLFLDNRTLLTITLSAVCVYLIVKYFFETKTIPKLLYKVVDYLGSLTMGIFLLGDLMILIFISKFQEYAWEINTALALLLFSFFVFICSGIITIILKKIPVLKNII